MDWSAWWIEGGRWWVLGGIWIVVGLLATITFGKAINQHKIGGNKDATKNERKN